MSGSSSIGRDGRGEGEDEDVPPLPSYRTIVPPVFPTDPNRSVLGAFLDPGQRIFDAAARDTRTARTMGQLGTADDEFLTALGLRFKTIGKRRGRGEEDYRQFLRSIVVGFQSRGRKSDLRETIASGLLVNDEPFSYSGETDGAVELVGHSASFEYDVIIHDHAWNTHSGGLVGRLAEYADAMQAQPRRIEYRGRSDRLRVGGGTRIEKNYIDDRITMQGGSRLTKNYEERLTGEETFSQIVRRLVSSPYTVSGEETVSGQLTVGE